MWTAKMMSSDLRNWLANSKDSTEKLALSQRRSPNDAVNPFKLKFINWQ